MMGKFFFRLSKVLNLLLSIVFLLAIAIGPAAQAEGTKSATASIGQPGLSFRYENTFGVTGEPYVADGTHLNEPWGMFMDASNNLYIAEGKGDRLLKYNSIGENTLILGQAGVEFHHDSFMPYPKDVAVDTDGNIWVVTPTMLKEFDGDGVLLRRFPDEDPWNSGNDNTHFNDAKGIALNQSGLLFVGDFGNQRVQVYDVTSDPPTYVNTIGETGVADGGNQHFSSPGQLAFDNSGALFVLDTANYRVQKCTSSDAWENWSCSTFFGGSVGSNSANGEMSWSHGIHIDQYNNVFIADSVNSRVLKCTPVGVCTHFVGTLGVRGTGNIIFGWAADVTTDSNGNVYILDLDNRVVKQYSSTGTFLKNFAGTANVSYLTDTSHINEPWGIATDSAGNIYVNENQGHRLLKFDSTGTQKWAIGTPGNFIFDWNNVTADNSKFSDYWAGLEGSPAVDALGNIYVSDTSNHRVQVYKTSDGSYVTTMGVFRASGADNAHFNCPTGAAISPLNGDILIVDKCNQRVQVFNSSRVYKTTIGVTEELGSDNAHLYSPWGVAVDKNGAVYIADADNHRIQKCTISGTAPTCSTFAGETGVFDSSFNHFHPLSVAVDSALRVYVADEWNNRIQVYDSTGAYLTTIAGIWGRGHSQLMNPSGVAVDASGNVYIADRDNHRVEKYAPGYPGWVQTNINGFGNPNNTKITRTQVHNGMLYASTQNPNSGGEVWRSTDGQNWVSVPVSGGGFGSSMNTTIDLEQSFNGFLYAGTQNTDSGGEMWRCAVCDGSDWVRVLAGSVLGADHFHVQTVITHANVLYATVDGTDGVAVIRSADGTLGSWQQVNDNGFGESSSYYSWTAADFNGYYYVATSTPDAWNTDPSTTTGVEVWRCATCTGLDWEQVNADGFGDGKNGSYSITVFNGALYLATSNLLAGTQIRRCTVCNGSDWEQVNSSGFGSTNKYGAKLVPFDGKLYAFTADFWESPDKGAELFASENGTDWTPIMLHGWGDSNNSEVAIGQVFNNSLYIGSTNSANGGEIWLYLNRQINLPLVRR